MDALGTAAWTFVGNQLQIFPIVWRAPADPGSLVAKLRDGRPGIHLFFFHALLFHVAARSFIAYFARAEVKQHLLSGRVLHDLPSADLLRRSSSSPSSCPTSSPWP